MPLSTDEPGVLVDVARSAIVPAGYWSVTLAAATHDVGSPAAATVTAAHDVNGELL